MNKSILALMLSASLITPAIAFDHGFDHSTDRSKFFESLKRPDYYPHPCCGESDAYEADIYQRNSDGSYDVTITNGEDENPWPDGTSRIPLKNGTVVHVPSSQINPPEEAKNNPTGHAWLFVSIRRSYEGADNEARPGVTYCFVPLPEGS